MSRPISVFLEYLTLHLTLNHLCNPSHNQVFFSLGQMVVLLSWAVFGIMSWTSWCTPFLKYLLLPSANKGCSSSQICSIFGERLHLAHPSGDLHHRAYSEPAESLFILELHLVILCSYIQLIQPLASLNMSFFSRFATSTCNKKPKPSFEVVNMSPKANSLIKLYLLLGQDNPLIYGINKNVRIYSFVPFLVVPLHLALFWTASNIS